MSHLTMEQLLELREPGLEPGQGVAQSHLETCATCRAEADRLAQRIARLKALPAPRPSRARFLEVRAAYVREHRGGRLRRATLGILALAASVALVAVVRSGLTGPARASEVAAESPAVEGAMARSRDLEAALRAFDPDSRVLDGRTAGLVIRLEDQVGAVDRQLEMLSMMRLSREDLEREQLRLWRERVGLLDALVDVHLTRATYAGM